MRNWKKHFRDDPTTYHRKLKEQEARYMAFHPRSWEMDFDVAAKLEKGWSVTRIAMEIHCYETTVYRAIKRIEEFLFPGKEEAAILKQFVEDNPPDYGDGEAHSILEMLYCHYEEYNRLDNEQIQEGFHLLYQQMEGKTLQEMDPVINTASVLCRDHEKAGFVEGVKVGIRLAGELNS